MTHILICGSPLLLLLLLSLSCFLFPCGGGTANAEIEVPSAENPKLSNPPPPTSACLSRLEYCLRVSPADRKYASLISVFQVHSVRFFFPRPGELRTKSDVCNNTESDYGTIV